MTNRGDRNWRIGIDTGGTFTDLVAVDSSGNTILRKVSSTPSQPSLAVFEALARTELDLDKELERFILGTTIVTNAVIQRKGAETILLTTAGFEDVLYIQRIDRPKMYDLQWVKAEPYARRRNTVGVPGRVLADGSIREELSDDDLVAVGDKVEALLAENSDMTVAIAFLFSYLNDAHERRVAEYLGKRFPDLPISMSCEVAPVWREYERTSTTAMDAYCQRVARGFLQEMTKGLEELGIRSRSALMKSNGGQVPIDHAADRPIDMVLSGLSGGMIAGHFWSQQLKTDRAVSLDMGGTSADVGVIIDGRLGFSGTHEIEWGIPITIPVIDVTTIGAGGSSIATIDYGGLLRVGPESAGADPGPACYGKGGMNATITDANVVLGRLDPSFFLGGELALDADLANKAVGHIAEQLDLDLVATANAIIAVAVDNMAGAVRLVTVDRGYDYRDFDLIAFGGAGPLHAARIADRLGMRRAIIPPSPGLVSAFGTLIADERIDQRITLVRRLDNPSNDLPVALAGLANSLVKAMTEQTGASPDDVTVETSVSCRYVGQNYEQEVRTYTGHLDRSFELAISIDPNDPSFRESLIEAFHESHRRAYGYALEDQPIESVYLGATALIPGHPVRPQPYSGEGNNTKRSVCVDDGAWVETEILDRNVLNPGDHFTGPLIVMEPTSTTYVPPGFDMVVDEARCLILSKGK
jgi:N-methylhydantoinase A